MIEAEARKDILSAEKPDPPLRGEPYLGGYYTEEEIDAVVRTMRESMDWHVGFGFMTQEILDFEKAFADFCGTEFAISINGAGTGLDMAMMALDLEPGDEVIAPRSTSRPPRCRLLGKAVRSSGVRSIRERCKPTLPTWRGGSRRARGRYIPFT